MLLKPTTILLVTCLGISLVCQTTSWVLPIGGMYLNYTLAKLLLKLNYATHCTYQEKKFKTILMTNKYQTKPLRRFCCLSNLT